MISDQSLAALIETVGPPFRRANQNSQVPETSCCRSYLKDDWVEQTEDPGCAESEAKSCS